MCDFGKAPLCKGSLSKIETCDKNPTYDQTIGRINCFTDTRRRERTLFSAFMGEAVDDLLHLAAAGSVLCPVNQFLALGLGEGGISVHGRLILGDGHKKTNGRVSHNAHLFRVYTEYSTKRVKYAPGQAV